MKVTWRTELPQWVLVVGMFVFAVLSWSVVPERLPAHWNAAGQVNRYGGKFEVLLLLPVMTGGLYLLLRVLPRIDPGRANYPRSGAYAVIRISTVALLAVIYGVIHLALRGRPPVVTTIVPLLVGGLFVVLGDVMGKIRPNWFVGIRTPWTLSSKTSWTRTHRLGGWLFILAGLAMLTAAVLWARWAPIVILVAAVGTVVWAWVYSYLVWRRDPEKIPPVGTLPAENL